MIPFSVLDIQRDLKHLVCLNITHLSVLPKPNLHFVPNHFLSSVSSISAQGSLSCEGAHLFVVLLLHPTPKEFFLRKTVPQASSYTRVHSKSTQRIEQAKATIEASNLLQATTSLLYNISVQAMNTKNPKRTPHSGANK